MLSSTPNSFHQILADAAYIPISSENIDVVLCITSLEFMKNPASVLNEIYRTLKNSGIFLCLLLNPNSKSFQEKITMKNSYIGSHVKTQNYQHISDEINSLFSNVSTFFGFKEKNNACSTRIFKQEYRLLIKKAIK